MQKSKGAFIAVLTGIYQSVWKTGRWVECQLWHGSMIFWTLRA